MTQYTNFIRNTAYRHSAPASYSATQQVGYNHTKKINCGNANLQLTHRILFFAGARCNEFNVIFRTTTDEFIASYPGQSRGIPNSGVSLTSLPTSAPVAVWPWKLQSLGRSSHTGLPLAASWDYVQICVTLLILAVKSFTVCLEKLGAHKPSLSLIPQIVYISSPKR